MDASITSHPSSLKRTLTIVAMSLVALLLIILGIGFFIMKNDPDRYSAQHAPVNCALHATSFVSADLPASWGTFSAEYQTGTEGGYANAGTLSKTREILLSAAEPVHYFARKLNDSKGGRSVFTGIVAFTTPTEAEGEWLFTRNRYQDLLLKSLPSNKQSEAVFKITKFDDIAIEHILIDANSIQTSQGSEWAFIAHESNVFWIMNLRLTSAATRDEIHEVLLRWAQKVSSRATKRPGQVLCEV